jgi:tRNA (cmo5U34)-methyltransferase
MTKENKATIKAPGMDDEGIEPMADFFDKRVEGYEKHMRGCVAGFTEFYKTISNPIPSTETPLTILDLGCGTGLEIEGIFKKVPNASLTCVDVSREMLEKLKAKYASHAANIAVVNESYLTFPYELSKYDYIVSVLTMHHHEYDAKLKLYTSIRNALKNGACYIEGDYIVSREQEKEMLNKYYTLKKSDPKIQAGIHHIDIPFSRVTQLKLFKEAGFSKVDVIWEKGDNLIFVVYK